MRAIFSIMLAFVLYNATAQTSNITRVEYWMDTDPGLGSATAITSFTAGQDIQISQFMIPATNEGLHKIGVRSRSSNGQWSLTNFYTLLVVNPLTNNPVAKAEYWIDTDPGLGKATPVAPFTASPDVQVSYTQFSVPLNGLGTGIHIVGLRSMDAAGRWSLTNFHSVLIFNKPTTTITAVEYFWDTDPGLGNATDSVLTAPTSDIGNGKFLLHVPSNLSIGLHTLFVRSKDSENKWSLTNYKISVNVTDCSGLQITLSNDTVVCKGLPANLSAKNGVTYNWSPNNGLSSTSGSDITATPQSTTTYTVTAINGSCEKKENVVVTINPVPADSSGADKAVCNGNATNIGGLNNPAMTYRWSPATGLSNSAVSNPLATLSLSVTYTLTETFTATGCSASNTTSVTVNSLPSTPVISQSNDSTFTTTAIANAYQWYKDGSPVNGASNSTYVTKAAGSYTLVVTNANGCASEASNPLVITSTGIAGGAASAINIYPNPFADMITCAITGNEPLQLFIYNALGQAVLNKTINETTTINLLGYPAGLYTVILTKNGKNICRTPLIKQ